MVAQLDRDLSIYVGSTRSEWLPAKVLEYSILRRTENHIKLTLLYEVDKTIPCPEDKKNSPRTPFSFHRFLIPELSEYKGKSLYLDADMLVFDDIDYLFNIDMTGISILSVHNEVHERPQFSVMVLNNELLDWDITKIVSGLDEGRYTYEQLMYEMVLGGRISTSIPTEWNSLDHYNKDVKLLHYTNMHRQPWVNSNNDLKDIWLNELCSAISNNFLTIEQINEQVNLGFVRPSLIEDVKCFLVNGVGEKKEVLKKIDRKYVPPYKQLDQSLYRKIKLEIKSFLAK